MQCSGKRSCSCSCLSICLFTCKLGNKAILQGFFHFRRWHHQNRSNSARLPQFSKLTTSKTKQFCETSSISKLTTSKTKQFCETSFKNGTLSAELTASYQCVLRFFHSTEVLRLPQTSDAKSYEVLHLSRKIILANLTIWRAKRQPLSGNQRPDLLTSLLHLPCEMHLYRSSLKAPGLPTFLKVLQNLHVFLTFDRVQNHLRLPHDTTSERPKVVRDHEFLDTFDLEMCFAPQWRRTWGALHTLTSKCASRHNGVHFFDISTSKSAPVLRLFVHFDFDMCFAPKLRAIFHLSSGQMAPHPPL